MMKRNSYAGTAGPRGEGASRRRRESLPCRRVLRRSPSRGADWRFDPYRGCAGDCLFCGGRDGHAWLGLSPERDFGSTILVKRAAPEVLAREIPRKVRPGAVIEIGVESDPWQEAEETEQVTRRCLLALLAVTGVRVHLRTKSSLVTRDLDVLRELHAAGGVAVSVPVPALDAALARTLEPGAPSPGRRLNLLRRLRDAGVPAGLLLAPVLPGVNDRVGGIESLVRTAAAAGAGYVTAKALRLPPAARRKILGWLSGRRPGLADRYRERYGAGGEAPREYRRRLARIMKALRVRYGLAAGPSFTGPGDHQLRLPFRCETGYAVSPSSG